MKVLYFDTETTGLDPRKNALIRLAVIIEVKGEVVQEAVFNIQPFQNDVVEDEALKINGITHAVLATFVPAEDAFGMIVDLFDRFVDKMDREDKFIPAGFNVNFDVDFMDAFFRKNGDKYGIGSYIDRRRPIDPRYIFSFIDYLGIYKLPDYKLETIARALGIDHIPHDPKSDIQVTREIVQRLRRRVVGDMEILKIAKIMKTDEQKKGEQCPTDKVNQPAPFGSGNR